MVKFAFILTCGFIVGALVIENKNYFSRQISVPVAELPDAGVYDGKLHKGLFHGRGRIAWPNESYYEGEFKSGLFHGKGVYHTPTSFYEGDFELGNANGSATVYYANGNQYTGDVKFGLANGTGVMKTQKALYKGVFKDHLYHGKGELHGADGSLYVGEFALGAFHGEGVFTENAKANTFFDDDIGRAIVSKKSQLKEAEAEAVYSGHFIRGQLTGRGTWVHENQQYEGDFVNWQFHGKGVYRDLLGEYSGEFSQGSYHGKGRYVAVDGMTYDGGFVAGHYHGKGLLIMDGGDQYRGEFQQGVKHGKGVLTFVEALDGVAEVRGVWRHGKLIEADHPELVVDEKKLAEHALYHQPKLLEQSLEAIVEHDPEKIDLYFVGIAGDGQQGVFRREVDFIQDLFNQEYSTADRSITLINSAVAYQKTPLATVTSIEKTLQHVAQKMDAEQDILFVYLTSHGSPDFTFSLVQPGLSLSPLSANALGDMLKALPVRHKVVVISACFSGGFVSKVKDNSTMVITAAEADKPSFGCRDRAKMTYFGEAFFKDSLHQSNSFVDAFYRARDIVRGREAKEGYQNSNPLIFKPDAIVQQLKRWRLQMATEQILLPKESSDIDN